MSPTLSVIIVSWNTRDLLAQCLESVFRSQYSEFSGQLQLNTEHCLLNTEVFVVDNASSDGSAAMVRERFPQVRLIENRENVGFARANNQAIRESAGQYVLLLNSDTIVQPGALQNMVAFMQAHAEAGIVGAYLLNRDGTPQSCFGNFPTVLSETVFAWGLDSHLPFSRWVHPQVFLEDSPENGLLREPLARSATGEPPVQHFHRNAGERKFMKNYQETDWVQGAALMIRRDVLRQVGGMDESYFMYSEEIDLAYRVKQAGWRNYVLKTAPVIHLGQQSAIQMPARMKVELFRSKKKYFKKYRGAFSALFLECVFASSILAKRVFYGLTGNRSQSELWTQAWRHYVV